MNPVDMIKALVRAVTDVGAWGAQTWFDISHRKRKTLPPPPRFKIAHYPDHGFAAFEWCHVLGAYRVITDDGTLGVYEGAVVSSLLLEQNFVTSEKEAGLRINSYARNHGAETIWDGG